MDTKVHITAQWARTTSEKLMGEKAEKQLMECLDSIEEAVSFNRTSVIVYVNLEEVVEKELQTRDFKVRRESNFRDGNYVVINW